MKEEEAVYDHEPRLASFLHDYDIGWTGWTILFGGTIFSVWSYFRFFSNAAEVLQSCLLRVGFLLLWRRLRKGCLLKVFFKQCGFLIPHFLPLEGRLWSFDVLLGIP